jgi:hypothetical protein
MVSCLFPALRINFCDRPDIDTSMFGNFSQISHRHTPSPKTGMPKPFIGGGLGPGSTGNKGKSKRTSGKLKKTASVGHKAKRVSDLTRAHTKTNSRANKIPAK